MILEVAQLTVKPGQESEFEASYRQAQRYIAAAKGYVSHELRRCIEKPNRYLLLVQWNTVEDHTVGFRGSPDFQEWRKLTVPYYEAMPVAEHFEIVRS